VKNGKTMNWTRCMIEKLKQILWQIGIMKSCPLCGKDVKEVGYAEDGIWQYYKCSNQKCNFGKDKKLRQVSNGE
jgi:ribosomal protein L37AE/L43A